MNPWQKTTKGSIGWPRLQGSAVIKIRSRRFQQVAGFTAMTQIKVRETGSEALLGREWRRLGLWLWATSGKRVSGPVFEAVKAEALARDIEGWLDKGGAELEEMRKMFSREMAAGVVSK